MQGAGAAAMFATNTPLLMAAYQGRDRGVAFGIWGGTSGAAAAVGPVLGGVLTEYVDWRAIFLVNLPLTAVAVWITLRRVQESHGDLARPRTNAAGAAPAARIDWPGAASFTACAGALTYGLIRGGEQGWTESGTLVSLGGAVLALLVFLVVERRGAGRCSTCGCCAGRRSRRCWRRRCCSRPRRSRISRSWGCGCRTSSG